MAEFSTSIIDKEGVNIIYLKGYLDAHTAPALEDNFTELIDNNKFRIVVNFSQLEYISSAGLGVFMAYITRQRR